MGYKSEHRHIQRNAIKSALAIVIALICCIFIFSLMINKKEDVKRHKEMKKMTSKNIKQLAEHEGHRINLAVYPDGIIVLECMDCQEIIVIFKDGKNGHLQITDKE